MPRVSVVIPTWDRAKSFGRALDSVLAQTEGDFEVVVIDDGSPTDAAARAVRERADVRIRYIRLPEHRGVSGARTAGVQAATGKYVAFLDDDDEWLPEKLERQLETIEEGDGSVGAVYTARFTIDEKAGRVAVSRFPSRFRPGDENCVTTSSILIKRECLDSAGAFDEELEAGEDYDMWIRVAQRWEFVYIDVPLMKYYITAGSVSSDDGKKRRSLERILSRHWAVFARDRRRLATQYATLGVLRYHDGSLREAAGALWRAIKTCPLRIRTYRTALRTFVRFRTLTLMHRQGVKHLR